MSTRNKESLAVHTIIFGEQELMLHAEGALFWPSKKLLIFSDLHFEKGSYFFKRGYPVPLYDTRDTLFKMQKIVEECKPEFIICLGDSFHDNDALMRMHGSDRELLISLIHQTQQWYWIVGNHDKYIQCLNQPQEKIEKTLSIEKINFSHEFDASFPLQIIGHYHPKLRMTIKNNFIQGKCFSVSPHVLVMPALGSYAGGLDVMSKDFQEIVSPKNTTYYLLRKSKIWPITL